MHAAELTGWLEYLKIDDEVRANWMTYAIIKAFQVDKNPSTNNLDEEEVIDTTQPEFAQQFQGFITTSK